MKIRILLLLLAASPTTWGCWADIPLEDFVSRNPLVVQARIVRVDEAPRQRYGYDTAHLEVISVLKNATGASLAPSQQIKLLMPAKRNEVLVSTDIRYSLGESGYWILRKEGEGYKADYPKAFYRDEHADEVIQALEESMKVKFELKKEK
jgi:hypothetical protein